MFKFFSLSGADNEGQHNQLAAISLFSGLSLRELKVVSTLLHRRQLVADEVVFDEGEEGQAIYFVFSGRVVICPQGKPEQPIACLGAGQSFGELAMIDGGLRSAQARAVADSELGVMFRGDFLRLMDSHAAIAAKISFQLARHYAAIVRQSLGTGAQV